MNVYIYVKLHCSYYSLKDNNLAIYYYTASNHIRCYVGIYLDIGFDRYHGTAKKKSKFGKTEFSLTTKRCEC